MIKHVGMPEDSESFVLRLVKEIERKISDIDRMIRGNGQRGLVTRVELLEREIADLRRDTEKVDQRVDTMHSRIDRTTASSAVVKASEDSRLKFYGKIATAAAVGMASLEAIMKVAQSILGG